MAGSAALATIPICHSPLFLFWSLYLHLKNVMENLNYGFFLAICKEGARNYFLLPADMHYAFVGCQNCAGEIEYATSWMLYLRPCSVQDNMCFILRHCTHTHTHTHNTSHPFGSGEREKHHLLLFILSLKPLIVEHRVVCCVNCFTAFRYIYIYKQGFLAVRHVIKLLSELV